MNKPNQKTANQNNADTSKQEKAADTSKETPTPAVAVEDVDDKSSDTGETDPKPSSDPVVASEADLTVTPTPVASEAPKAAVELPTPTPAAPKPVTTEKGDAKVVVVESTPAATGNVALKDQLAKILKSVPPAYHSDITRVLVYVDKMAPNRPIDAIAGVKEQVALYRSIQNIINRQETYFIQLYSALLAIFKAEFKGALGDAHRLRFLESITLSAGDRKAFQYLTHLLCITADPVSRDKAIKTINVSKALENGVTPEGCSRVLNFYNL